MDWKSEIEKIRREIKRGFKISTLDERVEVEGEEINENKTMVALNIEKLIEDFATNPDSKKLFLSLGKPKPCKKVRYPKIKLKTTKMIALEKDLCAKKIDEKRERQKTVRIPKFRKQKFLEVKNIDNIISKRTRKLIEQKLRNELNVESKPRPKHVKPVSTDFEKRRLQLLNYFTGGGKTCSILPKEMTLKSAESMLPLKLLMSQVNNV